MVFLKRDFGNVSTKAGLFYIRKILLVCSNVAVLTFLSLFSMSTAANAESLGEVTGFTLIDAESSLPIPGFNPIPDNAFIDASTLPRRSVTIRANVVGNDFRGSVQFFLVREGSVSLVRTENYYPYMLAGDYQEGANAAPLEDGYYSLIAVPYSHDNLHGTQGNANDVQFQFCDAACSTSPASGQEPIAPEPTPTPVVEYDQDTQSPSMDDGDNVQVAGPISLPHLIPSLPEWEQNMTAYGDQHCNRAAILSTAVWEGSVWYYDGIRVYQQIAEYTGDARWLDCAEYVVEVYRNYVLAENGRVGGWRVFPHGLAEHFRQTGSYDSWRAVVLLANNSPFAQSGGGASFELSRETAYLIQAYLAAEQIGEPRHPMLATAVDYALGHLDQWTVSQTASYVQPFMVGLTFEALIEYYERTGDSRIPAAIEVAAEWLWTNRWDASLGYFVYQGHQADLNMLIAPAYAWLAKQTGSQVYRDRANAIFTGGVQGAWLGGGKQFSQHYRWSFDFIRWMVNSVE